MLVPAISGRVPEKRDGTAVPEPPSVPENEFDLVDREVAVALIDGVRFLVADREHRVAATVIEVGTQSDVGTKVVAVALLGDLLTEPRLQRPRNPCG